MLETHLLWVAPVAHELARIEASRDYDGMAVDCLVFTAASEKLDIEVRSDRVELVLEKN